MAMLAEPRRRKNYVLTPRGKPLYDDDSRFGSKILQKMGWSKGKGLGAKESGDTDFVRVNFKSDSGGLGFENRDDQWTQHEQGFNGLLQSLNAAAGDQGEGCTQEENEDEDSLQTVGFGFKSEKKKDKKKTKVALSGESLEEKSKKSKARVHYKKFTKGKDISQYSEKDLANIFGKKTIEIDENTAASDKTEDEENVGTLLENKTTSIADYFKQKMEKLKRHRNVLRSDLEPVVSTSQGEEETSNSMNTISDYFKRKMAERKTSQKNSQDDVIAEESTETKEIFVETQDEEPIRKKRKKDKKSSTKEVSLDKEELPETYFAVVEEKRKKKRKIEIETLSGNPRIVESTGIAENQIEEGVAIVSKKKSKKNKSTTENTENNADDDSSQTNSSLPDQPDLDQKISVAIVEKKTTKGELTIKNNDLDNIREKINTYTISSYIAEKFRRTDFQSFKGSNLSEFSGYSFDKDMKVNIVTNLNDEWRILNLWSGSVNKYGGSKQNETKNVSDVNEMITAEPTKLKTKKHKSIRSKYKRRNAFKMGI